ncbi:deoxynucleoside triphosphate triphosphohydrolase SAMHD1-like [Liolophura sinensis]|uniref:deoxynucleoside triphosphate triphosphohydrolase SAMHD1-like n=1 Tax=Liolophura sinensis TaxID=3198878 RepID=UPI0031586FC1
MATGGNVASEGDSGATSTAYKVVNDPIHGHIELHPLCVKVIDTPEFQRLRDIKQLGGCYFVYPGAAHNRFEHSIGTCFLAGELARVLKQKQPKLGINAEDILCVEIAGLCHDLGHGPFSHLFDQSFIPRVHEKRGLKRKWKHEDASKEMFDHLIKTNDLMDEFRKHRLQERDISFIKELIDGKCGKALRESGRGEKKFLYEIVANKRNGIDVDKWDYFARDCHGLGIRNNFDHGRLIKFARVIDVGEERQICYKKKEAANLFEMFHTRMHLHRRAYQHRVNKLIEEMITDALVLADGHIEIPGESGPVKMSEAVDDMVAYSKLTDCVLQQILISDHSELEPSQNILKRIQKRYLYKFVGEFRPQGEQLIKKVSKTGCQRLSFYRDEQDSYAGCMNTNKSANERHDWRDWQTSRLIYSSRSLFSLFLCFHSDKDETITEVRNILAKLDISTLTVEDLYVQVTNLNYGKGNQNPIGDVRFYSKENHDEAIEISEEEVSMMLPRKYSEQIIRLFCKKDDTDVQDLAKKCFQKWCKERQPDQGASTSTE